MAVTFDAHTDVAVGNVATAPSPVNTGTTLILEPGQGAWMPAPPFWAISWSPDYQPTPAVAKRLRITGVSGDTLTLDRSQDGLSGPGPQIGDIVTAGFVAASAAAIEAALNAEIARAESAEQSNTTAVSNEAATRAAADTAESAARANADATLIPLAQKNAANGVAGLDGNGLILSSALPSLALTDVHQVASQGAMLAIAGAHEGTVAVRTDSGQTFLCGTGDPTQLATWINLPSIGDVQSVNGQSGVIVLGATDVGAVPTSQLGAANGVATLGSDGLLTAGQRPPVTAGPVRADAVIPYAATAIGTGDYTGIPGSNIDNVAPWDGMVVLLTAEPLQVNNGPWVIHAGAWTRPAGYATGTDATGKLVYVSSGSSSHKGSLWGVISIPSAGQSVIIDTASTNWQDMTHEMGDFSMVNANSLYPKFTAVTVPSLEARILTTQATQATAGGTFTTGTYIVLERMSVYHLADYGVSTGDITASLQLAVYAAANSGAYSATPGIGTSAIGIGGIVEIPDGFFNWGSALANAAATAQHAAIDKPSNVWVRGRGHSATYLQLNFNSNCHGFAEHRSTGSGNSNAFWGRITDLTMDGRSGHQGNLLTDCTMVPGSAVVSSAAGTFQANGTVIQGTGVASGTTILTGGGTGTITMSQPATLACLQQTPGASGLYQGGAVDALGAAVPWCAIYCETNPQFSAQTGDNQFDPTHLYADLRINGWQGDGIKIHGRSDTVIRRVKASFCTHNGFSMDVDSLITECVTEKCLANGLEMSGHSGNRAVGNKFYNSYEHGMKMNGGTTNGVEIAMAGNILEQNNLGSLYINGNCGVHFSGSIRETGFNNTSGIDPAVGAWAANTLFKAGYTAAGGNYILVGGYYYAVYIQGTTGGAAPTWTSAQTIGATLADNTLTWVCVGTPTSTLIPRDVTLLGGASRNIIDAACSYGLGSLSIAAGSTGNDIRLTQNVPMTGAVQVGGDSIVLLNSGNSVQINGVSLSQPKAIYGNIFGDGSSGSLTLDGTTAVTKTSLAGGTYTMTSDMVATNVTVNVTVTLIVGGWRIFATGTVTNNGTISANGNAGSSTGTGGAATASNALGGGLAGGAGSKTVGTAGSNGGIGSGNSGAGGTGSSGAGGAARFSTFGSSPPLRWPQTVIAGSCTIAGAIVALTGSASGGGGGGDGTNFGGGGAGGAGTIAIFASAMVNNGTLTAAGAAGGTPTVGNCGGGGASAGGCIVIYTLTAWTNTGTTNVTGGAGGAGVGTGTAGGNGTAGTVTNYVLI